MRPAWPSGARNVAVGIICALLAIALLIFLLGHRQTEVMSDPSKVVSVPDKAVSTPGKPIPTPAPVAVISGRNWRYELDFPVRNSATLRKLIQCESKGLNISHTDSNGKAYLGILQFDRATWNAMEARFNFHGDPKNPAEAIHMADMMISGGLIGRWGCARSLGLTK
jgi:hypothetical protein